jgi:hypothetical protein
MDKQIVFLANKQNGIKSQPVPVNATKHYQPYEYQYELLKLWTNLVASNVSKIICVDPAI